MATLAVAPWRPQGAGDAPLGSAPRAELRAATIAATAVAATVMILLTMAGLSFAVQRRAFHARPAALTITVTGHQWWWHIAYGGPEPGAAFVTANELHLPAGVPVKIRLASVDVIHSLWVPNLFGKRDLIPGIDNDVELVADRPGVLRGQCAEFCGLQHAHMALAVVVQSKAEFDAWAARQRPPAEPPGDEKRRDGQAVFAAQSCPVCHTVRGSDAAGHIGPDLTHLASRRHIAAGLLPMTRAALASWIADPHRHKPGVHMPATRLGPREAESPARLFGGPEVTDAAAGREMGEPRDDGGDPAALTARLADTWATPSGLLGMLSAVDHKVIGRRYLVTAFVFLCLAGL